ncbi:MAG: hypothetical protein P8J61_06625 [Gammaproteobacteria bacterium]|nr:hypothetical protein [Gammaproteobacteria bacterium]
MHLWQELSSVTLKDIARRFGLKRYGTVSTTVGKLHQESLNDSKIIYAIRSLSKRLKAQGYLLGYFRLYFRDGRINSCVTSISKASHESNQPE